MTGFASFASKLASFKALVLKDSISPKLLGSFLEELLGFTKKNAEDIQTEIEDRSSSDAGLAAAIEAEAAARAYADDNIGSILALESTARAKADEALSARLSGLRLQTISEDDYEALGPDALEDTVYLITEEET